MDYYVPRLIKAGAIPKKDLHHNYVYLGEHRCCTRAKWNADKNEFEYWRTKFNNVFIDTCHHFEDDNGYALFVPIRLHDDQDFKTPGNGKMKF
jgi:hypothetical protein